MCPPASGNRLRQEAERVHLSEATFTSQNVSAQTPPYLCQDFSPILELREESLKQPQRLAGRPGRGAGPGPGCPPQPPIGLTLSRGSVSPTGALTTSLYRLT